MSKTPHDNYDLPWMVALREQTGASLCADVGCTLSGSRAHVGPCEPCACPLVHAIEECPDNRADLCAPCRGRGYLTCPTCCGGGCIPRDAPPPADGPPITHVAIRFAGHVWSLPRPFRHPDVLYMIVSHLKVDSVDAACADDEGFLDRDGRYLTREQALLRAQARCQILSGRIIGSVLTSEDLW